MFENLDVFRMSYAMAEHAATQQALSARNMANADTPGYTARDLPPFAEMLRDRSDAFALTATRPGHLNAAENPFLARMIERATERDPNGNSVSLEEEMLQSVNAGRQHDLALSIYKSSLGVLRTAIGRQ